MTSGCEQCHSVGKPNADGTIGTCTNCHTRHTSSVAIARPPRTCGQCHLGPDHSQIEIYEQSKHGLMFAAQEKLLDLTVEPKKLTTREMFVPTCATCHMGGLNGLGVTHDPCERLSYFLANAISEKRPNYAAAQAKMQQICSQCHTASVINRVYEQAEKVVTTTNENVSGAKTLMDGLRSQGLLKGPPFSQSIDFTYFDLWHYDGRTAKLARSWEALTSYSGMATIPCCEKRSSSKPSLPRPRVSGPDALGVESSRSCGRLVCHSYRADRGCPAPGQFLLL